MRHSGIAEHGRPIPANHGRACLRQCFGRQADGAGQVVMPRGDVGDHRAEGVEGRFAAPLELFVHVFLDQVQRHAARAFVHDLHAVCPSAAGEFSLHFEFAELSLVVGVGNRTGAQAVALMPMMILIQLG